MHINESQIFETWAPIIESKTGIKENAKLGWLHGLGFAKGKEHCIELKFWS